MRLMLSPIKEWTVPLAITVIAITDRLKNLLVLDLKPIPQFAEHSDHLDHSDVAHMSSGKKSSGACK